jgi:hypothetical protein
MANPIYEKEPTRGREAGEFWLTRFDRALRYRQGHWNGDKAWRRYLNLFRGNHWAAAAAEGDEITSDNVRDKVTVNITGSSVLNMLPFLIRRRPKFHLEPKRPEHDVSATIQDALLNYSWKEYKMQKQARKAALDGIIFGHGILKTGFTLEVDESYKIPEHGTIEYRDYIKKQSPWIRRISPFLFVFDPEAPEMDLDSARWCAEICFLPLQDILENERYSKRAKKAIESGEYEPSRIPSVMQGRNGDSSLSFLTEEADEDQYGDLNRIVCFELWDKRSGKYFFFAHGVPYPLKEEDTWPFDYLEGFPYEVFPFIPVPEEPFPMGMPSFIEDQQLELNRIRTAMFNHRRRFNRKYTAIKNEVDEEELNKLVTGEDGTVILVEAHEAVKPIDDANISSDEYNIESVVKQDIRELIGADELARGGSLPSRTTATEIQARTRLYGLKLEDRVEQFDAFVENVGRKVLQHIKKNWVVPDVVKIVGPSGYYWKEYTPEDIQAEVEFEVESTSAEMTDEVTDRQQAVQLLQILVTNYQLLAQFQVPVNWVELFKWVFAKFHTFKDVQRFFPASGQIVAPLVQEDPGVPAAAGANGGFNPAAPPAQSAQPTLPTSPENTQAQPGGNVDALAGLAAQLGGIG